MSLSRNLACSSTLELLNEMAIPSMAARAEGPTAPLAVMMKGNTLAPALAYLVLFLSSAVRMWG